MVDISKTLTPHTKTTLYCIVQPQLTCFHVAVLAAPSMHPNRWLEDANFPSQLQTFLFSPRFASELNPSLFTPKDAVKPSLAEIFDEMETLEPPTKTMQANYLAPPRPTVW